MKRERFFAGVFGSPKGVLALAAPTFGALLCARMIWLARGGDFVPCRIGQCELLWRDQVARPLGVPLTSIGLAYYLALSMLVLTWLAQGAGWARAGSVLLSGAGALVSIALTAYSLFRIGATCPWCTASAVASLVGFAAIVSLEPRDRRGSLPLSLGAAAAVGALLVFGVESRIRATLVKGGVLARLSVADLVPPEPDGTRARPLAVAFSDFGCGSCRELFAAIRPALRAHRVELRFVAPESDYSREAALLYLDARTDAERDLVLSTLLEDDSGTTDNLARARRRLGLPPRARPASIERLRTDGDLAKRLEVEATPTILGLEGGAKRVVSRREIVAMLAPR